MEESRLSELREQVGSFNSLPKKEKNEMGLLGRVFFYALTVAAPIAMLAPAYVMYVVKDVANTSSSIEDMQKNIEDRLLKSPHFAIVNGIASIVVDAGRSIERVAGDNNMHSIDNYAETLLEWEKTSVEKGKPLFAMSGEHAEENIIKEKKP